MYIFFYVLKYSRHCLNMYGIWDAATLVRLYILTHP